MGGRAPAAIDGGSGRKLETAIGVSAGLGSDALLGEHQRSGTHGETSNEASHRLSTHVEIGGYAVQPSLIDESADAACEIG